MNHLKGEDEIKRRLDKEAKEKKEREEESQKQKQDKEPIVKEIVKEFIRKIQLLRPELIQKVGPEEDEVSWWGGKRKHKYTSEYDAIRIYTSYSDAEHRSYYLTLYGRLYDGHEVVSWDYDDLDLEDLKEQLNHILERGELP